MEEIKSKAYPHMYSPTLAFEEERHCSGIGSKYGHLHFPWSLLPA